MNHGSSSWDQARSYLIEKVPQFYELEPGGALALDLGDDGRFGGLDARRTAVRKP